MAKKVKSISKVIEATPQKFPMARYRIFKHKNDTHPFAVFKFIEGPGANFWQQISKGYFYLGWALRFAKQRSISLERIER